MISKSWRFTGIAVLVVSVVLPVCARALRQRPKNRCDFDGMEIDQRKRVTVMPSHDDQRRFCSLTCAELWLKSSQVEPTAIYVTDEATGQECKANAAHFVRSEIVSHPQSRDRRHVFCQLSEAEAHVRSFRGRLLEGSERPFSNRLIN